MAKKDGTSDLRVRRTQKAIKHALLELIEEEGFEKITVKDITDKAEISRNTFYLHYEDKYDLTNKMCDELMRKLFFATGKQLRREQRLDFDINSAARIMQVGLMIIDEDKEEYRILFNSCGSDLLDKFCNTLKNSLRYINNDLAMLSPYSVEYIVSGVAGFVKYYVNNKTEDSQDICLEFVQLHLKTILDIIVSHKKSEN